MPVLPLRIGSIREHNLFSEDNLLNVYIPESARQLNLKQWN